MAEGGYKRCGGLGDILAGAIGACVGWDYHYGPALASWVIKNATKMAY
jgi:NAD(P)H-hydrate repair Nnr-like enzyme with NAD(P)H-hydrate dehydratase domain